MSARAPEPLITVRAGAAEPPSMALPEGQPIGPLSVGRAGTWRIVGPGVLEEHGFVYFNGSDLFLQSADPNSPLTANGAPIPLSWTAVYAPCEIGIGGARLWFGPPAAPAPSYAPAPAPGSMAPPPAARGFAPRVQGNDDEESTRLQSIEELQAVAAMRAQRAAAASPSLPKRDPPSQTLKSQGVTGIEAQVLAAAAAQQQAPSFGAPPVPTFGAPPPEAVPPPAFGSAPPPGAPPMVFPGPGAPPDAAPPPVAAPAKASWIGERWREASGPKKALMVLMAPLIWACWVIFTDKPPPPRPSKPAASATANPSATPSAGSPSAGSASSAAVPPATTSEPPPPVPSAKASASASAKAAASAAPSSAPASSAKTPQREAADAVAQGSYDKAAKLYEELARAHPEVPAYAEAARIMRAKAERR
jgi:hypothetical protein